MLDFKSKEILKEIAKKSIEHGLLYNKPWIPSVEDLPKPLQEQKASFVTLTIQDQLRGCIGSIFAQNPLAVMLQRMHLMLHFAILGFPH